MEIKIEVNEDKFKNVIEKELNAFSSEEIKDIVRECIVKYLSDEEVIKSIFLVKSRYNYGEFTPSPLLMSAAETINLVPAFEETQKAMIKYVKENYQEMMANIMAKMFVEGLAQTSNFSENISKAVKWEMAQHICESHMNNGGM